MKLLAFLLPAILCASDSPPQPGQLSVGQKFQYRVIERFGIRTFIGAAISATIGQAAGAPSGWGQDAAGFGQRYGSAFAGSIIRGGMEFGLETLLREDPRYFPIEAGTPKERLWGALRQTFICHTDSGNESFAYARIASAFGTGQLVNIWQPRGSSSIWNGVERGFIGLGADATMNVIHEFLPRTRVKTHPRAIPASSTHE